MEGYDSGAGSSRSPRGYWFHAEQRFRFWFSLGMGFFVLQLAFGLLVAFGVDGLGSVGGGLPLWFAVPVVLAVICFAFAIQGFISSDKYHAWYDVTYTDDEDEAPKTLAGAPGIEVNLVGGGKFSWLMKMAVGLVGSVVGAVALGYATESGRESLVLVGVVGLLVGFVFSALGGFWLLAWFRGRKSGLA